MAEQSDIKLIASVEFAADTQSKLQRSLAQLERGLTLKSPIRNIVGDADSLTKTLNSVNNRVLTLGASFNALSIGGRIFKDVISSTIEVEKSLVEINSVFQLSAQNLDRFAKGLFDVSRETSQSFSTAAEAAKEFSRQGLGMQETLKRTKDALTLTRLAGIDATEAVNTLTASINGFHGAALDSTQITNKLATVDAAFAVSSRDLAQGLARAGAAASDAGVSFDELIGLITAAQQTTARGGAVIGNSLKTIFTRIERSNTIDAFEELGVKVRDVQGNTLSAMQILKNFAGAYDGLGASVKKQAAELVGGVYQINVLKALLTDVSNQSGVFAQAQKISAGATEEATKRNEALNKSLDALLQRSATSAKQITSNLGSNSFLSPAKTILGGLNDNIITKSLEDASGKAETTGGKVAESFMKGLGNALFFGVTPIVATAFLNLSRKLGGRLFEFIKIESGLNTVAEQQKITQVAINQIYDRGGDALRRQLDSMTNLVQKATLYKALMASTVLAEKTRIEENKAIANILVTRPRLGKAGGYIPNAADGLASAIYSENQAISMGVGGAVPGSRAVVIPDFNFGGGKTGPIVANNSEFLVKNFANGGSAIFNRDMVGKYGLPSGAQPIAASGFVPNAAVGKISNPYSNPNYQRFLSGDISQSPEIKAEVDKTYRLLREQNLSKEAAFLEMEKEEKKRLLQNQKLNELGVRQISQYETSTITKAKETSLLLESTALKEKKNLLEKQANPDYQRFLSGDFSQSPEIKAQVDEAYRLLRNQNISKEAAFQNISKEAAFLEMEKEEKKRLLQNQKLNELGVKQISQYETSTITKAKETSLLLESIALKEKKNLLEKQAIQDGINIKVKKAYQEAFEETSYKPSEIKAQVDEAYKLLRNQNISKEAAFLEMEKEEKKRLLQNQKLNELGAKQISQYEASTITKAKETSLLLESTALKEKKNLLEKQAIQDDVLVKVKTALSKESSTKGGFEKWAAERDAKLRSFRGTSDVATGYFDRNKAYQRAMMGGSGGFGVDFDPAVEYALMSGTRKPSLWGRTKNYLSGENFGRAAFGASMIMPFVGGMLPSGTSGEFSGRSMGALSGALSGAGMGIAFGSMIGGPKGAAIGGIAGALVGGATGAIQKWNKSFEELAQEIQDANAKNGEQITNAANFIQIQQKIAEAISNGASPREVQSLIGQQSTSLMRVSRAEDRSALARAAGDETALGKIFEQISYRAQKESISREFLSSVGRANEGRGTLGRLFGSNFDVKSIESMAEQLASTVNAPENKAAFEKFKQSSADNPAKAFKEMMLAIGVSSDDIEKELEILSKKPDDFKAVLHRFVEKSEAGIKEASLSAESINVTSRRVDLSKLYKDIGMQLSVYGQRSAAERLAGVEVSGARSRAAIEISSSGLEQLQKTNAEALKAAQEELNINIEKSLVDGVAKIYDAASAYTTASGETPRTINAISEQLKNVKSEKDLLPIFESLGKSAESIRKVIENTYKDTAEMRAQGRIQIEKLSAIQRIDEIRARYEERNNILSGSRYSESGSAGFFQTVLGGRTRGISGKNPMAEQTSFLINEIEEISKLGITPSKEQRDILEQLKRRSAQSTYADILSTYTGKKVSEGGVDSAIKSLLEKPVNTLEDQVMQSNVKAIQIALKKLDETDTRKTVAALAGVTQESEAQKVEAAKKALQGISGDGLAGAVANKTISLGEGRIVESLSPLSGIEKIAGDILKKMDEARMGGKDIVTQQEARTNAILEEEKSKNIENERIIRALENVNKDKLSEKFPIEYAEARRISEIGGFSPYGAGTLLSNTSNEMTKSGKINSLLRQEFASAKETPLETYQRLTTSTSEASRLAGGVEALKFILDELLGVYSNQKVNLSSSGTAYEVYQKQGIAARKLSNSGFSSPQLSDFSVESKTPFYKMGFTRPISIDKDTQKTLVNEISSSIDSSDVGTILKEQGGISKRAEYEKKLKDLLEIRGTTGTQVSRAKMDEASRIGHEESDYMGSFTMGFQSHFNALRQDMYDLSEVGSRISSSIENSLGNAFGDFVTGAKSAKEAFRDFVTSVLADAARAFASKAVQQLIGASLGGLGLNFGGTSTTTAFAGGPIGFANGGKVPALLMGGEYVFSPQAAKSVGYDTLRSINRYAAGGTVVKGGSGVMDDVPAMLPAGSFVVRKSAVNRIGTGYLDSLASGGYVRRGLGTPSMTQFTSGEVGFTASYAGTPASTAAAAAPTGGSSFAGAAGGLAAGAVLLLASYLLGGGGGGSYKPKSAAEIAKYARELEESQNASLNSRPSGSNAFLISDGQGGYNYSGNVGEADVQRFADGGVAMNSAPITPTTSRNYGPAVGGISIAINNYGGQTTTSSKVSGGSGYEDQDFAQKLNRAVQEAVKQTLIEERRSGGMMQQFNRTAINSY